MLNDRDQTISQIHTKFDKLRGDFQHNLLLLEARDGEIRRLETALREIQVSFTESSESVNVTLDKLRTAEMKIHSMEHDKIEREAFWKVRFNIYPV